METESPTGRLDQTYGGAPPRGEEDVLWVCRALRQALRRVGTELHHQFTIPETDSEVDAEARAVDGALVQFQVTGVVDKDTLRALGDQGSADSRKDVDDLASEVVAAIDRKSARYSVSAKAGVVLALDAMRSPSHARSDVAEKVIKDHGPRLLTTGFAGIWLVGPTVDKTFELIPIPPR